MVAGWAEVARASDEIEAALLVEALRAAGLAAHVLSQKDHVNVVGFGGLAVVRVLVPAIAYETAIQTLGEP